MSKVLGTKIFLLLIGLFLIIITSCKEPNADEKLSDTTLVDALGNEFKIDSIPVRVITLAPSLTEMIFELGVDEHLIGNTLYCDYPEEAKKITKVGDILTLDFEKIISIKPDLIFITVEGNSKDMYNRLLNLGMQVFVSNPRNFEGIKKTYLDIAKIFDLEEKANESIARWDSVVNKISLESVANKNKTVMFLISDKPLMLAGKNTFVNKFIETCGAKNIAEDSPMNYPIYSREEVLKRNPDYIFYSPHSGNSKEYLTGLYPEWKDISAVQNNRVILIDPNIYFRPGPRFVFALEDFNKKLNY